VDNEGEALSADTIGVMLARDLGKHDPGPTFVVVLKSAGLFHIAQSCRLRRSRPITKRPAPGPSGGR
jgi:hypothetical protein